MRSSRPLGERCVAFSVLEARLDVQYGFKMILVFSYVKNVTVKQSFLPLCVSFRNILCLHYNPIS